MRIPILVTVGAVIALLALFGCPKEQPLPPVQTPPKPLIAELPREMSLRQRTTTPAPGSNGAVQVTIGDITGGQAMVSLALETGKPLLAPTSLREGGSASFEFEGRTYYVTLKNLNNELIGDDSAVLVIDAEPPAAGEKSTIPGNLAQRNDPEAPPATAEAVRIRKLIDRIRTLEGAVFIRNGEEHTPAEAASHLERKWKAAGAAIVTAEDFIEKAASKSSTTGEPYRIRFDRGETTASEWLTLYLSTIKQQEALKQTGD